MVRTPPTSRFMRIGAAPAMTVSAKYPPAFFKPPEVVQYSLSFPLILKKP
ncbi:MAG: hypothetical protein LBH00_10030 [Planctomycetaceae bacterium]|nr:hypothetical protein [Planctomycetaceae bacterium]